MVGSKAGAACDTGHAWPLGALGEVVDDALSRGGNVHVDVGFGDDGDEEPYVVVRDDGTGFSVEGVLHRLSIDAGADWVRGGAFGSAWQAAAMAIGGDVCVASRGASGCVVGLLSRTRLADIAVGGSAVLAFPWVPADERENTSIVSEFIQYSPWGCAEDVDAVFDAMRAGGTASVMFALKRNAETGELELDVDADETDVVLAGAADSGGANEPAIRLTHSLRSYLELLYLNPGPQRVYLRGSVVRERRLKCMMYARHDYSYTPRASKLRIAGLPEHPASFRFGFDPDARAQEFGMLMYYRGRLVRPYLKVGQQVQHGSELRVVGIIEADFLAPTRNMQGFIVDRWYQGTMFAIDRSLKSYWAQFGSMKRVLELHGNDHIPQWARCDVCGQWRIVKSAQAGGPDPANTAGCANWCCAMNVGGTAMCGVGDDADSAVPSKARKGRRPSSALFPDCDALGAAKRARYNPSLCAAFRTDEGRQSRISELAAYALPHFSSGASSAPVATAAGIDSWTEPELDLDAPTPEPGQLDLPLGAFAGEDFKLSTMSGAAAATTEAPKRASPKVMGSAQNAAGHLRGADVGVVTPITAMNSAGVPSVTPAEEDIENKDRSAQKGRPLLHAISSPSRGSNLRQRSSLRKRERPKLSDCEAEADATGSGSKSSPSSSEPNSAGSNVTADRDNANVRDAPATVMCEKAPGSGSDGGDSGALPHAQRGKATSARTLAIADKPSATGIPGGTVRDIGAKSMNRADDIQKEGTLRNMTSPPAKVARADVVSPSNSGTAKRMRARSTAAQRDSENTLPGAIAGLPLAPPSRKDLSAGLLVSRNQHCEEKPPDSSSGRKRAAEAEIDPSLHPSDSGARSSFDVEPEEQLAAFGPKLGPLAPDNDNKQPLPSELWKDAARASGAGRENPSGVPQTNATRAAKDGMAQSSRGQRQLQSERRMSAHSSPLLGFDNSLSAHTCDDASRAGLNAKEPLAQDSSDAKITNEVERAWPATTDGCSQPTKLLAFAKDVATTAARTVIEEFELRGSIDYAASTKEGTRRRTALEPVVNGAAPSESFKEADGSMRPCSFEDQARRWTPASMGAMAAAAASAAAAAATAAFKYENRRCAPQPCVAVSKEMSPRRPAEQPEHTLQLQQMQAQVDKAQVYKSKLQELVCLLAPGAGGGISTWMNNIESLGVQEFAREIKGRVEESARERADREHLRDIECAQASQQIACEGLEHARRLIRVFLELGVGMIQGEEDDDEPIESIFRDYLLMVEILPEEN